MNIVNASVHGFLDHITVIIFLIAPFWGGFSEIPRYLSLGLAAVHLLLTLLTDFKFGIIRIIPFSIHGWIERIVGPALVGIALVASFESNARWFYGVVGGIITVLAILTQYAQVSPVKRFQRIP